MKRNAFGSLMLLTATLIWGTSLVAQSAGVKYLGPFAFTAARSFLGGIVLLPVFATRRRPPAAWPFVPGALCGAALFITGAFQQAGIAHTTVGKAGFITSLYIVIVPLFSFFKGRKPAPFTWGCVFTAVAGMYLLCINKRFLLGYGDLLILISAVSTAAHILLVGQLVRKYDAAALSAVQFFACGAIGLAAALIFEKTTSEALLAAWLPVLYTGVLSSGVAYTLQAAGQKYVAPVAAALILSLESVFSVFAGWLALGETLSAREAAGCVLMFAAIIAMQLYDIGKKE